MSVYVKVDINSARAAANDAEKYVQKLYQGRKYAILSLYAELINPWVPYKTGQLANYDIDTADSSIIYTAFSPKGYDYSGIQYNKPMNHNTAIHPLATDHWNEIAQPIIEDDFIEGCKEILHR